MYIILPGECKPTLVYIRLSLSILTPLFLCKLLLPTSQTLLIWYLLALAAVFVFFKASCYQITYIGALFADILLLILTVWGSILRRCRLLALVPRDFALVARM